MAATGEGRWVGRMRGAARRWSFIAIALCLAGYGYGPEQDPLVTAFKQLAAHGGAGRWEQAEAPLADLEQSLDEIETLLGVDLAAPLRHAVSARNAADLARQLTALAAIAIELKFESSRREDLSRYYAAKYRVEAARTYYMELLAPAVRQEAGPDLHERIWKGFDAARAALGRPGFLGRGVVPPARSEFDAATRQIAADLREAFPFLVEVIP